jgi:hypothetical protein
VAQIGSFALLFALACSAYSVVASIIGIVTRRAFAVPLGETVRRAGIVTFALVFLAALMVKNIGNRQWFESIAAISRDGDPPPDALREVDPYHAPLDNGDLGIFDLRHFPRRPLGLLRAGMGWLLGLGSPCFSHQSTARVTIRN